jgi:hypothetical protein
MIIKSRNSQMSCTFFIFKEVFVEFCDNIPQTKLCDYANRRLRGPVCNYLKIKIFLNQSISGTASVFAHPPKIRRRRTRFGKSWNCVISQTALAMSLFTTGQLAMPARHRELRRGGRASISSNLGGYDICSPRSILMPSPFRTHE